MKSSEWLLTRNVIDYDWKKTPFVSVLKNKKKNNLFNKSSASQHLTSEPHSVCWKKCVCTEAATVAALIGTPWLGLVQPAVSCTLRQSSRCVCSSKSGSPQPLCWVCPTRQTACQQRALVPHLGKLFPVSRQLALGSARLPKQPGMNASRSGPDVGLGQRGLHCQYRSDQKRMPEAIRAGISGIDVCVYFRLIVQVIFWEAAFWATVSANTIQESKRPHALKIETVTSL